MLPANPPYDFRRMALSHGWFELAPNHWDDAQGVFSRPERLASGRVVFLSITDDGQPDAPRLRITVTAEDELSPAEQAEVLACVRRMFRTDEDLSGFYALCRQRGGQWDQVAEGLGYILRSPTVFEDVVRTICTTNVQWGGTKGMLRRLVGNYGHPYPPAPERRAFPDAAEIAAVPFDEFAAAARLGYRAEAVHGLAVRVAAGQEDLESLLDPSIPTAELRKRLLTLRGVGPYAAATLLMLLGHYDELPIDTVFRNQVALQYFGGQYPGDREAQAVYEAWGRWRYLAYWFDISQAHSS